MHHHHQHHHQRRRKKRPNYGTRTVELSRGCNGFGFTISGQQPCILSCIVANSPADQAGLRAGDFLISVNGLNVSKLPHEMVVQLIGNSLGTICMQIAENYFSDSSDEENAVSVINRVKPRYLHHKLKMNRMKSLPQKANENQNVINDKSISSSFHPVIEDVPFSMAHNIIHSPNASTSKDISNVSAMVKKTDKSSSVDVNLSFNNNGNGANSLEYRVIVGYLGTIEMPKQIATSSKLQTVQSCIRKMRQEKRNSITVLMTILPNCLIIRNSNASILATYPSSRLSYVSSSTESENRFFGLVTSAIFANTDDDPTSIDNIDRGGIARGNCREVITSNSCHVFVIDTKICDHAVHQQKAVEFKISCTKDPISNLCLEFPNNSEYVVNLIRSMYTMNVLSSCTRQVTSFSKHQCGMYNDGNNLHDPLLQANSPQPSNHSEITTSSNSDSGIGFHNDCTNISDRILVVEFPTIMMNRMNGNNIQYRPQTICNHIENHPSKSPLLSARFCKSNKNDVNTRLTVRAMPDPKSTILLSPQKHNIPDLLANFNNSNISTPLSCTRSCDDVITSVERDEFISKRKKQLQMSMDDITMLASGNSNGLSKKQHVFVQPCKPPKKARKNSTKFKNDHNCESKSKLAIYKLSPKVFGISRSDATSTSIESLFHKSKKNYEHVKQDEHLFDIWGSLQNLNKNSDFESNTISFLKETCSEPDLVSRALPSTSPLFRRWGQSSFRTSKQTHSRIPLLRKLSPLAASEINVYSKTMDEFVNDLNSQCIHDTSLSGGDNDLHNHNSSEFNKENDNQSSAVINWSTSFEKLLEDSSGLYTFAEFLKKEFSAENIYFWTACERYRQIDSNEERATLALEIYSKHLASKASEPVNVDSQARNITEESLKTADKNLFIQAQKQIFNLMKFDSYQRFIRSDLYKKCLEAESKNQPLPYPGSQLDELLKTKLNSPGPSKLKKSTSNAEDRRRKSLLPWHRKARCKSRDRNDNDGGTQSNKSSEKFSENSLKLPNKNSSNDIHSSRSSLSSFDATVAAAGYCGSDDLKSCSLCRVLICDGVTTIVQIRSDETIKQLIDRLLEKRGIHYQYFDVILSDQLKSIDVESSASYLAGKEVQIEQRVAFKLHLPDPKIISVKSKPKKVLYEVLKPILYKYNYHLDNVQVLIKDTHEKLNISVPVTEIDGQRLQIVLSKSEDCKRDLSHVQKQSKINHESLIQSSLYKNQLNSKTVLPSSSKSVKPITQQTTLDEITNKVFNELLQGKVESQNNQISLPKVFDHSSIKSDDCISETSSSLFERFCYRDSNILTEGLKGLKPRKLNLGIQPSTSKNLTRSQDGLSISTQATNENDAIITNYMKKPLIAKWKTGVKLQVPGKTENHDEFLEGLKRAQRARLEDQRGTEINSELPDFLKDKRKSNASEKIDKIWYNLSPVERLNTPKIPLTMPSSSNSGLSITDIKNNFENRLCEKPQPAPRLSIAKENHSSIINNNVISPPSVKIEIQELNCLDDEQHCESNVDQNNYSCNSNDDGGSILNNNNDINDVTCNNNEFEIDLLSKEPPPLPPKPKVLPIKPSNWGHGLNSGNNNLTSTSPSDISRRHANKTIEKKSIDRNVYLDQPSSSFV